MSFGDRVAAPRYGHVRLEDVRQTSVEPVLALLDKVIAGGGDE